MQSRMPESAAICRAKNGAGVVKHLNHCFTCLLSFNRQFYLNFTSVLFEITVFVLVGSC